MSVASAPIPVISVPDENTADQPSPLKVAGGVAQSPHKAAPAAAPVAAGGAVADAGAPQSLRFDQAVEQALAALTDPAAGRKRVAADDAEAPLAASREANQRPKTVAPAEKLAPEDAVADRDPLTGRRLADLESEEARKELFDPTDELDVDTTTWTSQASRAFERLKAQRKQLLSHSESLQTQVQDYERQLTELKGATQTETVEQLQERLTEFEKQRSIYDLENTRAYQEAVANPIRERLAALDEIAERAGADPDELFRVISEQVDAAKEGTSGEDRDQLLEDLLAGASPRDKAKAFQMLAEVEGLLERRSEMALNAKEALREAQEYEQQQQQAKAAEEANYRRQISAVVVQRIAEKVPYLAQLPGVNLSEVQKDVGETDVRTLHAVDAQYQVAASRLFPHVVNDLVRAQAEIEDLVGKLAAYENAAPGAGSGRSASGVTRNSFGSAPTPQAAGGAPGSLSFADAVEQALRSA